MRAPHRQRLRPAVDAFEGRARRLLAAAPAEQEQRYREHAADGQSPVAEALDEEYGEYGEEHELSATGLREHGAEPDERQREHREHAARQRAPLAPERERERQARAAGERELVRILQRTAVAHATLADGGGAEQA